MRFNQLWSIFFVLCLLAWAPLLANGQSTTGSIYGTVADSSGAVIPGAKVIITDVHTSLQQTATTNSAGEFVFPNLNPSDYTVQSSASGFKNETQNGVTLAANQNVHVRMVLQVGNVSETVQIQAGVTLVDTREAQLAET